MENRTLKNASVRKDVAGDVWLFIEAQNGDLKATFCISRKEGSEGSIARRALEAWISEQDQVEKDPEFPDVIDG